MPSHRDAANTSVAWKDKTEALKPDSPPETRYVSSKVTWGTSSNPDGGYSHQHVPKRSHDSVCLLSPTNPTSRAGSLAPRHLHPPPCPGAAETRFYFDVTFLRNPGLKFPRHFGPSRRARHSRCLPSRAVCKREAAVCCYMSRVQEKANRSLCRSKIRLPTSLLKELHFPLHLHTW